MPKVTTLVSGGSKTLARCLSKSDVAANLSPIPKKLYRGAKPDRGPKGTDPPQPKAKDFTPRPVDNKQLSTWDSTNEFKNGDWYAVVDTQKLPKGSVKPDMPPQGHWVIDFDHPDVTVEGVMKAVTDWGKK